MKEVSIDVPKGTDARNISAVFANGKIIVKYNAVKQLAEDGDMCVIERHDESGEVSNKLFIIYKCNMIIQGFTYVQYYYAYDEKNDFGDQGDMERLGKNDIIRPALEDERIFLFRKMHFCHLDWNEDQKRMVQYDWKPEIWETFYCFNAAGMVIENIYRGESVYQKQLIEFGNCFKTADECRDMAEYVGKTIRGRQKVEFPF